MKKRFILPFIAFLLCATSAVGEITNSKTYDFRDGTIITNSKSDDGSLTLSGNFSKHSDTYGLNMKIDGEIKIVVAGSSTFRFLGSAYSKLNMVAMSGSGSDLGTQNTQVSTDLVDVFDFVYSGGADTITFKTTTGSGDDLYLPTIEVIPAQSGAIATTAEKNISYFFDFRDGSIVPTTTDGKSGIDMGLIGIVVGNNNAYGYNGSDHGSIFKLGNQINLTIAGNSYIKVGGCTYSNGTFAISSPTGQFDIASQDAQTATEFHADGATVDFLYVGDATTVTLDFTGTNYVPYIEVSPVPYEVVLDSYIQKSGTITINGVEISLTAGADLSSASVVTVSAGTVISATDQIASLYIDLAGNALSSYTPTFTGDIASVDVVGDSLITITYASPESNPKSYTMAIADNSAVIEAEAGKTYAYDLANGSELPQTGYSLLRYPTYISKDGILTMKSNTSTESGQFGFHDTAHGAVFFPGNSIDMIVAGDATITFATCQYGSASDAVFTFKDADNNELGSIAATNIGINAAGTSSFTYTGGKGVITATLTSVNSPTAEIYIHGLTIENAAIIEPVSGKIEAWDFGGVQLDTTIYKNNLTVDIINGWYDTSIAVGSSGATVPSFSAGVLSWVGGGNDRIRTTNTAITRYDANIGGETEYTGRVYVNSSANPSRYMSLTLSEDDEVTILTKTDAGGNLVFQYVPDPSSQTDEVTVGSNLTEVTFVAKEAGTYHIFDNQGKPSYYRFYRKDANYHTLTGNVDVSAAAGIPSAYAILFENEAGKTWTATMSSGSYSVKLPIGYTYAMSLADANGYVINNGSSIDLTDSTTTYNVSVQKVELFTVTGSITGLGDKISAASLTYSANPSADKIYIPEPVIDVNAGTYSVQLEANCEYTISASGVNDYFIPNNTITITGAKETSIAFEAKTLHKVTINATGLTPEQTAKLSFKFTNLNEAGYVYSFSSINDISLRDGVYSVTYDGLDEYAVSSGLISNLQVDGADTEKTIVFKPVTNWSFDDKVITASTTTYKGMLFSGNVANEIAKGHLNAKDGSTVKIPVKVGDKIRVTYYYTADFSIEGGDAITTVTKSTTTFEFVDYIYTGTTDGYVTINVGASAATTYITDITIGNTVDYAEIIYVGTDKTYKTINEALTAISKMIRNNNERVTVMIDAGNYEEMLVINLPNITLKNGSATPDIALANKGVDISANAVRITSYYGHGYNYYSMGNDQKWNGELLQVNKDNGYLSYENEGSGTINGSFWNATVVVSASGFTAEDIIFENSFNQYISQKEADDVVEEWSTGGKGTRPTEYGSTDVQNKNFVERAAAIAITNDVDKVVLSKCRVIGRQDSFYGGTGARVTVYRGAMMGGTDYIFGGMTALFYKTALVMNTSEDKNDVSYITAAQQKGSRGYLMYECTITSATPGTESASAYRSKPGYFGRPWEPTTSEVVYYNTTIETTNFPGSEGKSLIVEDGWNSSLGGTSAMMYEFGTVELSGIDNTSKRSSWATLLTKAELTDGTALTTTSFIEGNDSWDPITSLIENDKSLGVKAQVNSSNINLYAYNNTLYISNVVSNANVLIYSINGSLVNSFNIDTDTKVNLTSGLWIVKVSTATGQSVVKVSTY